MSLNLINEKAYVVYHANCNDGFGAAYTFHRLMEHKYKSVSYFPTSYGMAPPMYLEIGQNAPDLYVLDFSFKREQLQALASTYEKVTLIDHHKTCYEDLKDWIDQPDQSIDKPPNLDIHFSWDKSGAKLSWEVFRTVDDPKCPNLIAYISDQDLWKFALIYSRPIREVISLRTKSFEHYRELENELDDVVAEVAIKGELLLQQKQQMCKDIIEAGAQKCVFTLNEFDTPIEGLICNATAQFASDIGNILAQQSGTFGATYFTDRKRDTIVSLRSIGDFDVSKIAEAFGGGGHKNAAGFKLINPNSGDSQEFWIKEFNIGEKE